jgi:hypothetical protein
VNARLPKWDRLQCTHDVEAVRQAFKSSGKSAALVQRYKRVIFDLCRILHGSDHLFFGTGSARDVYKHRFMNGD